MRELKKKLRKGLAGFLAICLIMTSFNTVAWAETIDAQTPETATFMMLGDDVKTAAQATIDEGSAFNFEDLGLDAKDKNLVKDYKKLFEDGSVYEIAPSYDMDEEEYAEGAELRMFIRVFGSTDNYTLTGDETIIFLYINNSENKISFRSNVDGNVTQKVTINSHSLAFGEKEEPKLPEIDNTLPLPGEGVTGGAGIETEAPEETTAAPEETTAASEETTAAPEETAAALEEATTALEETTAAPEETTAVPEETTAAATEAADTNTNEGLEEALPLTISRFNAPVVAASLYEAVAAPENDTTGKTYGMVVLDEAATAKAYVATLSKLGVDVETEEAGLTTEADGFEIRIEAVGGQLNPAAVEVSAKVIQNDKMETALEGKCLEDGKDLLEVKLFDITLLDVNGEEVQPDCEVKVSITGLAIPTSDEEKAEVGVYHLEEETSGDVSVEDMEGSLDEESQDVNFKTTHFSTYGVMTYGLTKGAELPEFESEEWCDVDYKEMSEYLIPDYGNYKLDIADDSFFLDVTIDENAEGDLDFILSEALITVLNKYAVAEGEPYYPVMPGDHNNLTIRLHNNSGHTYEYGGAVIATSDTSEMEMLPVPAVGFDGQYIPRLYTASRVAHPAIQSLFGVTSSNKVTLDNMLTIYDKLAEKNYTGNDALTQYCLDYYNELDGTSAGKISELKANRISQMCGSANSGNGLYTVKYAGSSFEEKVEEYKFGYPYFAEYAKVTDNPEKEQFTVQFYEAEQELSALQYNRFYQELLGVAVGVKTTSKMAGSSVTATPLSSFMDEDSENFKNADEYLRTNVLLAPKTGKCEVLSGFYINGPQTGNVYQNYDFAGYTAIELKQIDGTLTINKVDSTGSKINAPAAFHLYQTTENGPLYYAEDGTWSPDKSSAKSLTTENGSVTVSGLTQDATYYIVEIQAPAGYELSTTPMEVTLNGPAMEVDFVNVKEEVPVNNYTITVNYLDKETNEVIAEQKKLTQNEETSYDVTAAVNKTISNYTWDACDNAVLSGTLTADLVFNVYYVKEALPVNKHTITINYLEKGTNQVLADRYISDPYEAGSGYDVTALVNKEISRYNWDFCDNADVTGTIQSELVFNVYYTRKPGGGGNNGGSDGPNPSKPNVPGGPGDTTVTILPEEVPLASLPGGTPGTAESDLTTIDDSSVPLAGLPKTGNRTNTHGLMLMIAGLLMAAYTAMAKRKEEE